MSDINLRVKRCEEELDDEIGGEDDENRQSGDPLELGSKQGNSKANLTGYNMSPDKFDKNSDGEGDSPNIGDIKNHTQSPLGTIDEKKSIPSRMNRFAAEDNKINRQGDSMGSNPQLSKSSFRADPILRKSRRRD